MDEKANTPSIRFAGFTNTWEKRKLAEAFLFEVSNNTLSRAALNYEEGEVKSVHYGDILIKYGAYIDTYQDDIPYITGGKSQDYTMQLLREGDIIFADTAEDETAGKVSEIVRLNGDSVVSGLHTIVCRPLEKKAPYYLGYYLNSDSYHRQLLPLMQGIKVLSLSRSNLVKTFIHYPQEEKEQAEIGTFFRALDNLITLHQHKHDKLVNIKKSMLEKMFPQHGADVPEIRFAGFTDSWERRKVGDIVTDVERPITMKDEKVYQLVTVKRRNEGVVSRGFLKGKDILVKNYFMIHEGDYLISKRQVIHGANGYVPKELNYAVVSNEYMVAVSNEFVSSKFWVLMSKRREMYRMFLLSSYGVDIEKMVFNVDDWKKRFVMIPSMSEQNRIISFFENLDTLITLHQRKLTKLQNIKKSCLEKMFV